MTAPSIKELFGLPGRRRAALSPDGRQVAYLAPWRDRLNVFVRDLDSDWSALTRLPARLPAVGTAPVLRGDVARADEVALGVPGNLAGQVEGVRALRIGDLVVDVDPVDSRHEHPPGSVPCCHVIHWFGQLG